MFSLFNSARVSSSVVSAVEAAVCAFARAPMTGGGHLACALLALLSVATHTHAHTERKGSLSFSFSLSLLRTRVHNNVKRVHPLHETQVLIAAFNKYRSTMQHGVRESHLSPSKRTQRLEYTATSYFMSLI